MFLIQQLNLLRQAQPELPVQDRKGIYLNFKRATGGVVAPKLLIQKGIKLWHQSRIIVVRLFENHQLPAGIFYLIFIFIFCEKATRPQKSRSSNQTLGELRGRFCCQTRKCAEPWTSRSVTSSSHTATEEGDF